MGHREDLLEGAKRCLMERGYGRTTARDIVEASNTNLGSIGYHYGTKDRLLLQAMVEMSGELAEKMIAVDGGAEADDAEEHLRRFWAGMIDSFRRDRALWKANLEILTQTLHDDELRHRLADTQERGRVGLGQAFASNSGDAARAVGAIQFALITGIMTQHLVDPERAPTADEIVAGLRAIAATA